MLLVSLGLRVPMLAGMLDPFIPGPTIVAAIACALSLPLLLLLFGHGPATLRPAGARFKAACLAGIGAYGAWSILAWLYGGDTADIVAGWFILATSAMFWFVPWSLLAWGFTLHMLTVLARSSEPVALDRWIAAYTGGASAELFASDRLHVLLQFGMARLAGGFIVVTPSGRAVAALARLARILMGLR